MNDAGSIEPTPPAERSGVRTTSLAVLATVATAAALFFGRELFVPIVFAILLNALFRPVVLWLDRRGLPTPISAAVVMLALLALLAGGAFALSGPVQRWLQEAPQRFNAAEEKLKRLRQPVQQVADVATKIGEAASGPTSKPSQEVAPAPVATAPTLGTRFMGVLTEAVEILLLLYLLLASGDMFYKKLIAVIPYWRDKRAAANVVEQSQGIVMRYLLVNLFINAGQGVLVGLVVWWLGMPGPVLWGLFTVLLEFIPYLGATVMVALLSVIAFATFDNLGHTLAVPASYLIITTIQNNIVSPYLYGQHLKLNPVAVLVGVLLWYFLWGVPGAFLAVPIVATLKVIADHVDTLKPVGEFLGE